MSKFELMESGKRQGKWKGNYKDGDS